MTLHNLANFQYLRQLFSCLISTALGHLSDSKLPKDEALQLLRVEMQRCLGSLKGKRQKISQLHEELQLCQGRVNELQTQLDEAKLSSSVRTFVTVLDCKLSDFSLASTVYNFRRRFLIQGKMLQARFQT